MKLIIDVPENEYRHIKEIYEKNDTVEATYSYIYHGRPLEQEPKTEWIPVSERLPENNMPCLVSVGEFFLTQIAIYSDLMGTIDHKIFYIGDYGKENFEDITKYVKAWMPLPKPYEPQESEDKE